MAAPVTTQATASGLRAIQAISAAGKAASAAGWAQNEETESVDAHEKAATPPGTRPWRAHGWPPVPGQPFPKCLPPMTTTASPARKSNDGPRRPRGRPRAMRDATLHATGSAASSARTAKTSIAPDITKIATVVPAVSGSAHCQPMVSCDHMAPPKAEEDGRAAGERGEAGADLRRGLRRAAAQPGVREPRDDPAPDHVRRARPRPRSLADVGDQELGELLAVARPPRLGVPAQQPRGARRGTVPLRLAAQARPQFPARRRNPRSATRRCASRWARSVVAPTAVSR